MLQFSAFVFISLFLYAPFLSVSAFKAHEFKKCSEAHFCKRNRDRAEGISPYYIAEGSLKDGKYTGIILNTAVPNASSLSLSIFAYSGGIIRIKIDEIGEKKRFEVPDVIEPDFDQKFAPLASLPIGDTGDPTDIAVGYENNGILVRQKPFLLAAFRDGEVVMSLNSKGLFNFEHTRTKQEGDETGLWEETFRSHSDSKPKGPQAISFDLSFLQSAHVYGIPERATHLALQPTKGPSVSSEPYRLYNLDVFEYDHHSPFGLYGSIPFMMSHNTKFSAGFFWLNAAEMWVDVLETNPDPTGLPHVATHWISESGIFDGFLLFGPSPKDVVQQYTTVTGKTRMPQLFSIAYHQCRWNYKDEADVTQVDTNFDSHDIPYDTLWLDIEHTDGKKYMTWDSVHFPTPVRMQDEIAAKGRHMVTIVDPHMKRDDGYPLHTESTQKGYYVKDKNGNDFDGWCWPGSSSYLDMLSPAIRAWWAGKFSYQSYKGSTPILHIWNDMNEPSVFNGPEVTMPKDNLHFGGVEHRDVHNAYGYYYHMATADGLLLRNGNTDRPFVLSRAVYAGTQKVGPIWTGDNTADWDHLNVSVPMLLTLGLSGVAFSGADVGGFFRDPDGELMTRWFQLGAFYPFFRGHAHLDTKRREPWIFGEPYTSHIREAIRTRYALLPYIYSLFREAATDGTPLMRPLWMEFPLDTSVFAREDSFLLGPALLIRPVVQSGTHEAEVYFPGNEAWYHFTSGQAYPTGSERTVQFKVDGLGTVLVFQKAGTIIPRKDRTRRSSTQMELDPYTLVVALDSQGQAEGELYIDDGKSYEFTEGAFINRKFTFTNGKLESRAIPKAKNPSKSFSSPCTVERIIILGLPKEKLQKTRRALIDVGLHKEVEEELGPAYLRQGLPLDALVVRAPLVRIDEDWSIKVFDV